MKHNWSMGSAMICKCLSCDALWTKANRESDDCPEDPQSVLKFAVAQLRHAYTHLKAGKVTEQKMFADGLLSPQIARLERLIK